MASHLLSITLDDIEPVVSRVILVPSDYTLTQLHGVIQSAFGWENRHDHQFSVGSKLFGALTTDGSVVTADDIAITVEEALGRKGASAKYVYDHEDKWTHSIVALGIDLFFTSGPECLDADGATPPDGCGGPGAYADLISRSLASCDRASGPQAASMAEINERLNPSRDANDRRN